MKLENLGGGTSGTDPNARVMAVLTQMGLEGVSRLPNGAILLPDGRVVGEFGLDGGDSGYSYGEVCSGDLGEGFNKRSAYMNKILKDSSLSVQILVRGLDEEVRAAKTKLQVSLPRTHRDTNCSFRSAGLRSRCASELLLPVRVTIHLLGACIELNFRYYDIRYNDGN